MLPFLENCRGSRTYSATSTTPGRHAAEASAEIADPQANQPLARSAPEGWDHAIAAELRGGAAQIRRPGLRRIKPIGLPFLIS